MGHSIGGGFLKATTKEEAMREGLADAREFAWYNVDRDENPSGEYYNDFRFYNRVFDDEEEAEEFFNSLGSYRDGVCMVKEASKSAQNKYRKAVERVQNKKQELRQKALENFKNRTSASIGCKKCSTRITAEEAIKRHLRCPSCGNWLVPDSVQEKMKRLDESLTQAEEQLKKDAAETGKPRYWAKYEVHC